MHKVKKARRKYPSIANVARSAVDAYVAAGGGDDGYAAATAALETYILTDRKISRLTEQLKDAVVDGGLDDVESIRELFRGIYRQSTLDGVDEEGKLRAV